MKKESKKQLILSSIATLLIVAGYFNFQNIENEKILSQIENDSKNSIGDVELVSSNSIIVEENVISENIVSENIIKNEVANNISVSSNEVIDKKIENININSDDYFETTRLERENMYSRMLESYGEIINNDKISSDQKVIAIQEVSNINNYKNGIMISENLIKNKGFEDVVILINNNTVSVVVKKDMLQDSDVVKIQNIIETKLGFSAKDISISNR